MRTYCLPSGRSIPALGLGTWGMGENAKQRPQEVAALKRGLELGMTLIDTAEMYAEGGAEQVIAEAIAGQRQNIFLVSKVYPHNATHQGTIAACERSLQRLNTDYLDLYLLHWPGATPIAETLQAFQELKQTGKIRDYGVSNFDKAGMAAAKSAPGGEAIATNQVLYNLARRGVEWDLLPWCREHQIPVMAYSPIEQGRLLKNRQLQAIAQQKAATPAQVAIAWLLHQDQVIVIPKASSIDHVEQNRATLDLQLSKDDLATLDTAFPPPTSPKALEML
ncbi:MAG: aldo/keto reductase [Elainellaceae cyanobacterium]